MFIGMSVSPRLFKDVVPKIGLEVHAQLAITQKLFSQGLNNSNAPPNSQLDLFDISMPGTLPKLNSHAIRYGIISALGLNCEIQRKITFERKNYFYSDLPAGYQLTQNENPIAKNGFIDFIVTSYHKSVIAHNQRYDLVKYVYNDDKYSMDDMEPYVKRSQIKQAQLEQDSAKTLQQNSSTGEETYSLIDYNRAGTALIEIVFEPDLQNHHEASSLVRELVILLKSLGTCDGELQNGSLRVDANVSIDSIEGHTFEKSNRVEIKNLNSLRSLNRGIYHEIQRQAILLKEGKKVIQETRTFDSRTGNTVPMRLKENVTDYRYFHEPSIPPLVIPEELINECRAEMPSELPHDTKQRLINEYKLDLRIVIELVETPGLSDYFFDIMDDEIAARDPSSVADFLIYSIANLKEIPNAEIEVDFKAGSEFLARISPERTKELFRMVFHEEITYAVAYEVMKILFKNPTQPDPRKIVEDLQWFQLKDPEKIEELLKEMAVNTPGVLKKYRKKGEKRHLFLLINFLCQHSANLLSAERAVQIVRKRYRPEDLVDKTTDTDLDSQN